ncbi:5-(carboxyamino)imidazole ribonucleotide synthase [Crocosphaera sp. XPORK-15E]|uniref:5-(carboxyamino)imidazole ribonucleotide synthase n=1 Tax=Crocosphaera sp. XPORK-15E TaxID=3110247 RepID=UPI002B1FBC1B|nr:5-(carboxyamino)imidazole ribonucleotide synthase [Crocosphaera sp. XPORK-15E]MEA5534260.1 5-(carboxyamino)imidazole ribonucleotide synthase [Crocosphaera sp. XPORK-15E]
MSIKRVGVIGGGQLAWMMAGAAQKLGVDLIIQTPHQDDPAVAIANQVIFASIDDANATAKLAEQCDVITFENEFIDLDALKKLEATGVCFRPSLSALSPLLDKYQQRSYLQNIGIPVPLFALLDNPSSLNFAFPVVVKARRHGYDGQGTFIINTSTELTALFQPLKDVPLMVEEYIPFEGELAIMAARNASGEVITYPVVETYQQDQVCRWVIAPANIAETVTIQAKQIAEHLLTQLDFVGIFGIEFFLTSEGKLLVNEIAPRTHNSGHYTLDACDVSQFEMQLRAVTEHPLGSSELNCLGAVMVNLLGYENSHHDYAEKRAKIAEIPHAYLHWYGKTESRLGRKLGHVTVLIKDTHTDPKAIAKTIESIWYCQE